MVKRLSTTRETWVRSLGREDPLEKDMAATPALCVLESESEKTYFFDS